MIMTQKTKVRMLAAVAGGGMPHYDIHGDFLFKAGDTPELHPDLAAAWVNCGHAERPKEEKKAK